MAETIFEEAIEAILNGDADKATEIAKKGLDEGTDPLDLMDKGFIPGINKVGDLFETGRLFLPALIYSATAMEKATEILNAAIPEDQELVSGKVLVATVEGDVHDIGKTIVVSLFKANGFEVMDLGIDVPPEKFVDAIKDFQPSVVGLSGFLTLAFDSMKETVDAIKTAGLRDNIKIMIGGGQIDDEIKNYTSADAYGKDAMEAVKLTREWIGG